MAVIDIREAVIRLWDGTVPTKTVLTNLLLTAVPKHLCSQQISITIIDPAQTTTLGVVTTGFDIVVTLGWATDAVTTDLDAIVTLLNADADAKLLVLASCATGGDVLAAAVVKTYLTGQNNLEVKVGEGNLTYSEQSKVKFILDRGSLDSVKTENDEPVDLSFDFTWEFLQASTGGAETIEDVLKKTGEGAGWVSSADDPCQAYCIDVELMNEPGCAGIESEQILFEEFYYENLSHDLKAGTVACKGRCNRSVVTITRGA